MRCACQQVPFLPKCHIYLNAIVYLDATYCQTDRHYVTQAPVAFTIRAHANYKSQPPCDKSQNRLGLNGVDGHSHAIHARCKNHFACQTRAAVAHRKNKHFLRRRKKISTELKSRALPTLLTKRHLERTQLLNRWSSAHRVTDLFEEKMVEYCSLFPDCAGIAGHFCLDKVNVIRAHRRDDCEELGGDIDRAVRAFDRR